MQAAAAPAVAKAAEHAVAKLHASLPQRLKGYLKHAVLHEKRFSTRPTITIDLTQLREAAWLERAIDISYIDGRGAESSRRVYPLSIGYLDEALVLVAHCCMCKEPRVFRLDRIQQVVISDESFHPKRVPMLAKALKGLTRS